MLCSGGGTDANSSVRFSQFFVVVVVVVDHTHSGAEARM